MCVNLTDDQPICHQAPTRHRSNSFHMITRHCALAVRDWPASSSSLIAAHTQTNNH